MKNNTWYVFYNTHTNNLVLFKRELNNGPIFFKGGKYIWEYLASEDGMMGDSFVCKSKIPPKNYILIGKWEE